MSKTAVIIGFGGMGQRHYHACEKAGVEVVAICDWKKGRVMEVLPDFPEANCYEDYKELLKNTEADLVSVVTNGPTHPLVSIAASEAGFKNILCEKPVAVKLEDAQKLNEVCKKNGTRIAVNHIRRWNSDYARLKKMIEKEDVFGEIKSFYFSCGSTGLGNFTSHFFDAMRMLTGSEAEWILGFIDKTGTKNPRGEQFKDPAGYGVVQFKNGARAMIDTSEETGVQYSFQIVGGYGRIIIDELNNSWQVRTRKENGRRLPFTRYGTSMEPVPFKTEKFDIIDLTSKAIFELVSGKPISCTVEDGLRSLEMVVAFHVSDEKDNSKVQIPLDGAYYGK